MPLPEPRQMEWLFHFTLILAVLDAVGVFALILICYFLYKAYRISNQRLFLFFFVGYAVLAAGESARFLLLATAFIARARLLMFFLAHNMGPLPQLFQTIALLFIAGGYALELAQARVEKTTLAILPLPLLLALQRPWSGLFVLLTFINLALLVFIILNASSVYFASRSKRTLLIVIAFLLLLLSNILMLPAVVRVSEELFIISKLLYLIGLLTFLLLAIEVAQA